MKHCCEEMEYHLDRSEIGLCYHKKIRWYSIAYRDGGDSFQTIQYCPWCGSRLPEDLGDQWQKEIELLGFEPGDPNIPKEYKSDRWWKKKKSAKE
jgi:hypothetical protein